jgi:hypothetical protein
MVSGIFRMTMWNQTIPARLRGRLAGLEMISYTTGQPLGNVESGVVASLTSSVRFAIVSGGILCIAGAAAVVAALPMLWRYDARRDREPKAATAQAASPGSEPDTLTACPMPAHAEDPPARWSSAGQPGQFAAVELDVQAEHRGDA